MLKSAKDQGENDQEARLRIAKSLGLDIREIQTHKKRTEQGDARREAVAAVDRQQLAFVPLDVCAPGGEFVVGNINGIRKSVGLKRKG